MNKYFISFFLSIILSPFGQSLLAAPVPYSGKVAINGLNFQGDAQFTFALRDANGTVHWRNGADANASINVPVDRGLYIVLLGGQGMNPIPSSLFLEHHELYLETRFYRPDTQEWLHMLPDQRITSAPHALSADLAELANLANLAKAVEPGAITKSMLAADVLADLNATVVVSEQNNTGQIVSITRDMLPWDVLQDLNGTISRSRLSVDILDDLNQSIKVITRDMLPWDVLQDLNGTISRSRLSVDVLDDLNQSIKVITRDMLPWDVLQDLNGTISRSRLSVDVLDDLNQSIKAITRDMLPWDVLQDLNGTISRSRLSVDVLDDLNQSIKAITRDMLPWDVLQDLNGTISRSRLSVDVLDDLNQSIKVITRDMLPWDVLQDLNGTISRSRLSVDVLDDLNQSIKVITRDMLPWDVLQDLNGTISRSRLSVDVLDDLNSTIAADSVTLAMLSPQVRADLNSSIPAASVTAAKMHPDLIKYFLPEITSSPAGSTILQGAGTTLAAGVAGKFLTYQWRKNGANLAGETNPTLVIAEANATVHDANYTVVVSNDWGSVTTGAAHLAVATAQPVITLLGDANVTVEAATSYSDAGATAVDAIGGDLSIAISVSSNVNLMATGAYTVLYSVADAGGNQATASRTVNVADTTSPVVALLGDANVTHVVNTAWVDPGASAADTLDGNLSSQVAVSGAVDVNATGAYVLTYFVSDGAGNAATPVTRGVQVLPGTWDKRFGGSESDNVQDVIATADGGYLLAGYSTSPADGDKSEAGRGAYDYWAVKINASGAKVWDKRFGGSTSDYCQSVTATTDGGYLLAGYSDSSANGDKSEAGRGSYDYWAVKINASGTKVWDKRFGGSSTDVCRSVIATSDGGYLLVGQSSSPADGDKSEDTRGSYDYWAVKINASGAKVWDKRFGGTSADYCYSAIATAGGGYLLAGQSSSPADGDKSEGTRGSNDYWAVKIDADGSK
jgi:hypothetical protein